MLRRIILILLWRGSFILVLAQTPSTAQKLNDFVIEERQPLTNTVFIEKCKSPELGVIIFSTQIKNIDFTILNMPDALANVIYDSSGNKYILCLKPLGKGRKYQISITHNDFNETVRMEPTIFASENRVYGISAKSTSRLKKIVEQSIIGIKVDGGIDIPYLKNDKGKITGKVGIWKLGLSYLYPKYNLEEKGVFLLSTGINFGNGGFVNGKVQAAGTYYGIDLGDGLKLGHSMDGIYEKLTYYTINIPVSTIIKTNEEWFVQLGVQNNFNFRQKYKNYYVDYDYKSTSGNSIVKPYTMDIFGGIGYFSMDNHWSFSLTYTRSLMNQFNRNFTQTINEIEAKPLWDTFFAKNAITLSATYYFGTF